MTEAYCSNCKAKLEIAEAVEETTKDGRTAVKGKCPQCGDDLLKISGTHPTLETPPPPQENA